MFPLSMEELEIYGERPPDGTDVACRISVMEIEHHRLRVEAEIVRPDGTVWMRIHDWEDWRFHWPGRYRDVIRQPRDFWLGEELELTGFGGGPIERRKRSGSSLPPTWAGRSGATCSSRSARARRASCSAGFCRQRAAAYAQALGPDRRQGGRPTALAGSRESPGLSGRSGDRRRRERPARALLTGSAVRSPVAAVSIAHGDGVAVAIAASIRAPGWESTSRRSPSGPRALKPRHSPAPSSSS